MSSSATQVAPKAAQVNAAVTTSQIFPNLSTPLFPAILNIPAGGRLEQDLFRIRASGFATSAGATTTVTVTLYGKVVVPTSPALPPLNPASWTVLGASTARVVNTITTPWWIEAALIFDSVGGRLGGRFNTLINNLSDADAALTNVLTGLNGTSYPVTQGGVLIQAVEPVFAVCAGITFGVNAAATNIGNLAKLQLLS